MKIKKTLSIIIAWVLNLAMVLVLIPALPLTANANIASGTDWTLDNDGLLTIESNAGMTDWTLNKATYNSYVIEAVIQNGVTSIGDYAFQAYLNLTSVVITDSVASIGIYAFSACIDLTSVTFTGTTPPTFGSNVFNGASSLTEITVPCGSLSVYESALGAANLSGRTFATSVSTFAELQNLFTTQNAGRHYPAVIKITAPITIESSISIVGGADVTLTGEKLTRGTGANSNLFVVLGSLYGISKLTLENIVIDGANIPTAGALVNINSSDGIGGSFVMNDGAVLQNGDNSSNGGGVRVDSGTFTMNGGEIKGNSAFSGGGVYNNGGTFAMHGGEIKGNSALNGGGVAISGLITSTITLGGTAVVTGNENGSGAVNNVQLANAKYITLGTGANAPKAGMSVGITTDTFNGIFVQSGATAGDEEYFTADADGKAVFFNSGKLGINFFGGEGTASSPYLIQTAADLAKLAELVNAGNNDYKGQHYTLTDDIDLSGYGKIWNGGKGWEPIGNNT
ncbi:MAG: leucine-rich repeat domain-containing protein, partial [Oscillospiraceae bacterium]|nr:leucine-rich repeat domain-containing protein [Oscillospiraceae bacterium]